MDKLKYYLGTGLKVKAPLSFGIIKDIPFITRMLDEDYPFKDELKYYMRPLSSLTKPITVEGYNDGKPFFTKKELGIVHDITKEGRVLNFRTGENIPIDSMPFWIIEKLISWHFWIGDQTLFGKSLIEIED